MFLLNKNTFTLNVYFIANLFKFIILQNVALSHILLFKGFVYFSI